MGARATEPHCGWSDWGGESTLTASQEPGGYTLIIPMKCLILVDKFRNDVLEAIDDPIEQVSTDGAYEHRHCYDEYDEIAAKGAKAVIPPRKDAVIWQHGIGLRLVKGVRKEKPHPRDENLRHIRKHGRKRWKCDDRYHRRSIAETTMFRFKTSFGGNLSARKFDNQAVELFIQCAGLNRMIQIAKPDSYEVKA
jgi:hypothetical protein